MRKSLILVSAFMLAGGMFAQDAPQNSGSTPSAAASPDKSKPAASKSSKKMDDIFAKKAAQGGMAEVQLGQMAAQKGSDPAVKAFGQRMVDDHTKAGDQLKSVASQESLQLPTELSAKDKAEKARLEKLSGTAFDKAYINHMVTDHKKDIAEFQREANDGKDDAIKNFASQTLPTLQDHLKQAQDAQKKVASGGSSAKAGTSAQSQ